MLEEKKQTKITEKRKKMMGYTNKGNIPCNIVMKPELGLLLWLCIQLSYGVHENFN